ncbi:hypothetical protein SAMN04488037_109130 [Shimia marina]|uniref:Uncharacterized protein n=1 Tax=Shimia marina TaxID=321267 RepID=A0A0P1ENR3_9RHOB|nr:hypothetical protein SHM7688_01349 [Shimia marina]SFE45937.1 hypothetical protein SAMN04488037_109130 [Shimia marina]
MILGQGLFRSKRFCEITHKGRETSSFVKVCFALFLAVISATSHLKAVGTGEQIWPIHSV